MKFIHISDLHIHYGEDREETVNARLLIDGIIRKYADDEKPWIIITGDIVQDGLERQYKMAVEILSKLKSAQFKLFIQPGNHDYGPHGYLAYTECAQGLFQKYILDKLLKLDKAKQQGVRMENIYPIRNEHLENIIFIGLDSIAAIEDKFLHFSRGSIGKHQRDAMMDYIDIAKLKGKKVVVCLHHHPFYRDEFAKPIMELEDSSTFMETIKGKVDVLCFGHKHKSNFWSTIKDNDKSNKSKNYNIPLILASGKSVERDSDGKLTFREIEITDAGPEPNDVIVN